MPGSLRLLEEYGDDLAVIFVESQGATAARAESFAYDRGWMGRGALWTLERPASTGLGYLPSFILLDTEGRVLLKGNTANMKSDIEDEVEAQLKAARALPEGFDRGFKKAWKAMQEGDYAKAHGLIEKEAEDGGEVATQAAELASRLDRRFTAELDAAQRRMEAGFFVQAQASAERLAESVEGHEAWSARVEALIAALSAAELAPEFEADEKFSKLYEKVCEDGIEDHRRSLEKFAEKHAGTRAAERAAHLVSISG